MRPNYHYWSLTGCTGISSLFWLASNMLTLRETKMIPVLLKWFIMKGYNLYSFIYLCIHFSRQERQIICFLLDVDISMNLIVRRVLTELTKLISARHSLLLSALFPVSESIGLWTVIKFLRVKPHSRFLEIQLGHKVLPTSLCISMSWFVHVIQ